MINALTQQLKLQVFPWVFHLKFAEKSKKGRRGNQDAVTSGNLSRRVGDILYKGG